MWEPVSATQFPVLILKNVLEKLFEELSMGHMQPRDTNISKEAKSAILLP